MAVRTVDDLRRKVESADCWHQMRSCAHGEMRLYVLPRNPGMLPPCCPQGALPLYAFRDGENFTALCIEQSSTTDDVCEESSRILEEDLCAKFCGTRKEG